MQSALVKRLDRVRRFLFNWVPEQLPHDSHACSYVAFLSVDESKSPNDIAVDEMHLSGVGLLAADRTLGQFLSSKDVAIRSQVNFSDQYCSPGGGFPFHFPLPIPFPALSLFKAPAPSRDLPDIGSTPVVDRCRSFGHLLFLLVW